MKQPVDEFIAALVQISEAADKWVAVLDETTDPWHTPQITALVTSLSTEAELLNDILCELQELNQTVGPRGGLDGG